MLVLALQQQLILLTVSEFILGTIDSCIPGGWYLVPNLFKNDNLDVVISSLHLELIPEKRLLPILYQVKDKV